MKVTYTFIDSYHSLCLDKKDIISAEIEACDRLLKYTRDERDNESYRKRDCRIENVIRFDQLISSETCDSISRKIVRKKEFSLV